MREALYRPQASALENVLRKEDTMGTARVPKLVSLFVLIFFGKTKTLVQRVEGASEIINFLRPWRIYVHVHPHWTITGNFYSRESFQYSIMQCQMVLNLVPYTGTAVRISRAI